MSEVYQCSALKADKKPCTKPGVELYDKQYYCKVHFKSVSGDTKPKAQSKTSKFSKKDDNSEDSTDDNSGTSEFEVESNTMDDIDSDSDLEEKKLPKEAKKPKKASKFDINICEGFKKDGNKCEKKGTELHNDKHYCKVHLNQIIKNENIKMCNGFKKDGDKCEKKASDEYNDKHYCKVHLKQEMTKDSIKYCEGFKKDGDKCEKKGTELHNEKNYCKAHLKTIIAEENIKYCDGNKKNGDKCEKKANNIYNNKHYCTIHFKPFLSSEGKSKDTTKDNTKDNGKFEKEEARKITKEVQDFVKISSTKYHTEEEYTHIKKVFKDLARKIHPDKCKNINLNANELFQKMSAHMDKIKKYEVNDSE